MIVRIVERLGFVNIVDNWMLIVAFNQNFMGNQLTVEFMKKEGFKTKIQSRDYGMKFTTNVEINNSIKFCSRDSSSDGT